MSRCPAEASSPAPPRRSRPRPAFGQRCARRRRLERGRLHHRRRRRGRDRGGAAAGRRRAQLHAGRGVEPDRRALLHRDAAASACRSTAARISIHNPDINPLTKLAARTGLDIYPAPSGQRIRIGRRNAREGELEDFLAASVRANRAIARRGARQGRHRLRAARCRAISATGGPTVEFALGPYISGKDLGEISAVDLSRAGERDTGAFCRQGYGALLAKLAEGIPVQLDTAVKLVDITGARQPRSSCRRRRARSPAATCIITASTNVVLGPHQVRRRPAEAPAGCAGEAQARQLRSHRAGAARQSARPAARRSGVREVVGPAHRRAAGQCRRHAAVGGLGRRPVRPRSRRRRATRRWSISRSNGSPACSAPT